MTNREEGFLFCAKHDKYSRFLTKVTKDLMYGLKWAALGEDQTLHNIFMR